MSEYKQLPSGKPYRSPTPPPTTRPIYVARPVDTTTIIDVVPEAQPPYWHQAPTHPAPPGDFANPYSFVAPPRNLQTPGFTAPPSAGPISSGPSTFPANFAAEYEKYQERHQSPGNFGINVDQADPNRVIVSFYGSRWIVALFFLGIMLIGFSLDKVPDVLPYFLELVF